MSTIQIDFHNILYRRESETQQPMLVTTQTPVLLVILIVLAVLAILVIVVIHVIMVMMFLQVSRAWVNTVDFPLKIIKNGAQVLRLSMNFTE